MKAYYTEEEGGELKRLLWTAAPEDAHSIILEWLGKVDDKTVVHQLAFDPSLRQRKLSPFRKTTKVFSP